MRQMRCLPRVFFGLVVSLVVVSGCGNGNATDAGSANTTKTTENAPPAGLCQVSADQECFRIGTGQWVSVAHREGSKGYVLLDLGGPGYAAVDTGAVQKSLPAALKKYSVVKVYEPWVGQELFPQCKTYFAELSWSAPGVKDPGGCIDFVSDFAQPELSGVVSELSRRLSQNLAGIVTFSFGSTRTREIWPLLGKTGTLLVVQPAPTPALSIDRILALRAEAAWNALTDLGKHGCSTADSCATIDQVRARLTARTVDKQWSKTGTEMSLFVIGAIADTQRYKDVLMKLFTAEAYSPTEKSDIRRVAMSVSHSLGPDTALTSNAGYRAAMCQAYGAPGRTLTSDPLELAFRAQVGPCGESTSTYTAHPAKPSARSCLVTTSTDPVLPPSLLDTSADFGKHNSVAYSSTVHGWPSADIARLSFTDQASGAGCQYAK